MCNINMKTTNHNHPVIIFDFGGVLMDWNPYYLYRKLLNGDDQAVEQFLGEIGFTEWNLEQDRGRSFREGVIGLCAQFPEHQALIRASDERWEESIAGAIQGTVDLLQALKQAGYRLYGLSNFSVEKFEIARRKYPFFDWFDDIIISAAVGMVKPDPRIYALLLERLGRPARECIFIDDSPTNLVAAREMGFTTIQFDSPAQLENELRQRQIIL